MWWQEPWTVEFKGKNSLHFSKSEVIEGTMRTTTVAWTTLILALSCLGTFHVQADELTPQKPIPLSETASQHYGENVMSASLANANLFTIGGTRAYYFNSTIASWHWQLDEVSNTGWLRGNTEWITSGFFAPVLQGPESRFAGVLVGPRYNFVQEGWKWVPFIESRVGVLFADSRDGFQNGLGQDFNFTFTVSPGVKYHFDEHWAVSIAAIYQHISNGGLSEPGNANNGIDGIGPVVSANYTF